MFSLKLNVRLKTLFIFSIMDVESRYVLKVHVGQTNSNPIYIGKVYLDLIKELMIVPRRIRIDRGTETGELATIQCTLLNYMGIDQTEDMDGVILGPSITNKIERFWLTLREKVLDRYRRCLDYLLKHGYYQSDDVDDRQLLSSLFIPYIQHDVDKFIAIHNNKTYVHN